MVWDFRYTNMQKHNSIIKCITIGTLFTFFTAFSNEKKVISDDFPWHIGHENKLAFNNNAGLKLTLKNGTLTPTGATFLLKNEGKDIVYFGQQYFLQLLLDKKWFNIEEYTDWTLELIVINPGEERELRVDWSNFYGELPPGNYRFVKEFHLREFPDGKTIYLNAPFTVI